jgi:hypothetical protein
MILVAAGRRTEGEAGVRSLWAALQGEVARLGETAATPTQADGGGFIEDAVRLVGRAGEILSDAARLVTEAGPADDRGVFEGRPVAAAPEPDAAAALVAMAIDEGADHIVVLPLAVAVQQAGAPDPALARLAALIDDFRRRHPEVEIRYVGPPFDDPAALASVIDLLHHQEPASAELMPEVLDRAFGGDLRVLGLFLAALRPSLPVGTRLAIRGSAVAGESYRSGEPFDARGQGTSDLDLVVLGEEAMKLWEPEAFYFPGVNTMPLYDDARWVAPALDPARSDAQSIVGRPVSIQAMAPWFLDLRAALQDQPHLILDTSPP